MVNISDDMIGKVLASRKGLYETPAAAEKPVKGPKAKTTKSSAK
jgi:hypothetical protein